MTARSKRFIWCHHNAFITDILATNHKKYARQTTTVQLSRGTVPRDLSYHENENENENDNNDSLINIGANIIQ